MLNYVRLLHAAIDAVLHHNQVVHCHVEHICAVSFVYLHPSCVNGIHPYGLRFLVVFDCGCVRLR